ncbi:F-box protein CPR1-like [Lycium barbarum]|uniref:F-box protein CPR1-like n=1 Tax=Lycium barbarum TaxID=112863 RepID=UPI00293F20E8|nr:F-box protein CPR1-like [Lycium barbarum]XP_060191355.1 F-box protein CPR1-like [Lycium barbarum]
MSDGFTKKLAYDVVICILLRLPVKSLLRFKCVSKTCYTLLQSSSFINLHLNHTTTVTDEFVLLKRSFKEDVNKYKTVFSFFSGDGEDYVNPFFSDIDVPHMMGDYSLIFDQLIGPCNGLIALMDGLRTVIFNPSTRNIRLLPPSPFDRPKGFHRYNKCIGFGFDSIVNDYKVIRISEFLKDDLYGNVEVEEENVEIYELGIDCWRELDYVDQELPIMHWLPCSQMFYKGTCHWIAERAILCFDMSTEIFRNMRMPDICPNFRCEPYYSLVILNESLTLICYPSVVPVIDPTEDLIEIWIMKDYDLYESWIKKCIIRDLPIEIPLAVWKDNLLLFQNRRGFLMTYNLKADDVMEFNLHGCSQSMRVTIYKENMAKIPRGSENGTQVQKF